MIALAFTLCVRADKGTRRCQLFNSHGNFDLEGVDNINACYGGTAALLNTMYLLVVVPCTYSDLFPSTALGLRVLHGMDGIHRLLPHAILS